MEIQYLQVPPTKNFFHKERKDEARVCYKEALRWFLSSNLDFFLTGVSFKLHLLRNILVFRLWPTYVIAMNNLATVTDNESDIEVGRQHFIRPTDIFR